MQIGVKLDGKRMSWDEAFAYAQDPLRDSPYPPDLLDLMRIDYDDPDREPGIESFTPTRIMGCHRQAVLMEDHDYYIDPDLDYPKVRGHMIHALMEKARYPGAVSVLREKRMRLDLNAGTTRAGEGPLLFTAKPDLVVVKRVENIHNETPLALENTITPRATFKVVDYKSKSEIKHELTETFYEHELQVNMYAWMVAQNPAIYNERGEYLGTTVELLGLAGIPELELVCDEVEIVYCDMKKVRRFTSKGSTQTRGKRLNRSRPYQYETLTLAPIHLWTPEKVGRFIRRRIDERLAAKEELPPILPESERWRCDYCPLADLCYGLERSA